MLSSFIRRAVRGYQILSSKNAPPGAVTSVNFPPMMMVESKKEKAPAFDVSKGIQLPRFLPSQVKIGRIEKEKQVPITLTYPLIPKKPAKNEPIFAYAQIYWDEKSNKYIYNLVEPKLSEKLTDILKNVKSLLEQKLDVDFTKLKKFEAKEYLHKNIEEVISYYEFKMTQDEKKVLHYYIERDFIGLGRIEALMNDEQIEDVSCDGIGIPIFIFHRNSNIGSVESNIKFDDSEELDSFIYRLSQLVGKSISVSSPLVGGALPDGSRVQATLATDIARRGSNFTIRKFTEVPLTPVHILQNNTLDIQILAYLWLAVEMGKSMLVSGGTASGKTTLLNVFSLFIRPEKKICSIEDTPELKLPHPHWVPAVARMSTSQEAGKKIGEIDLFDLLKESLRQRPDYIIVGEVRGVEAYVLFQQMATGHPSFATIHAENLPKLVDRLTTPPISLPPSLLGSLDIVVFLFSTRYRDKQVRRVNEVVEIIGVDEDNGKPLTNTVFKWNAINDTFDISNKSMVLKKISESKGLSEEELKEELERRMLVLYWMKEKNISDYKDVFRVFNMYYSYPERVLSTIKGI